MKPKWMRYVVLISFFYFALSSYLMAAEVKLKWQPNSEADLQGYNVYFGSSSRNYGPPVPVGHNNDYTVQDLEEDQAYFFAVTALDTSGNESGFSAEITKQTAAVPPSANTPESTDEPVALWLMDEGQGMTLADASGNGFNAAFAHNGTSPNPVWKTDAVLGPVVQLKGGGFESGNFVDLGALDIGGDQMTLGVMFKIDAISPTDGRLIAKQQTWYENGHYWMLGRYDNGRLRFRLRTDDKVSTLISSKSNLYQTGDWVLATAVYDGRQMKIYCDGELVGSMAKTGTIDTNAAYKAFLGVSQNGSKRYTSHDGAIAYAFVYEKALSQNEIKSIHADGTRAFE